jgi:hypothetical protein
MWCKSPITYHNILDADVRIKQCVGPEYRTPLIYIYRFPIKLLLCYLSICNYWPDHIYWYFIIFVTVDFSFQLHRKKGKIVCVHRFPAKFNMDFFTPFSWFLLVNYDKNVWTVKANNSTINSSHKYCFSFYIYWCYSKNL